MILLGLATSIKLIFAIHIREMGGILLAENAMRDIDYPTNHDMADRWRVLLSELGKAGSGPPLARQTGELVVLGAGLGRTDFTTEVEEELRSADYVFYCLYDILSQVWLHTVRPDAFDLYILYSNNKDRYITYVQMAEAMLHYVRLGKKVVVVFYGHPGLFATPAHRAIRIAKNEGFRARMRPGISALDHLIADVGFDPAIPGMLNYEASDFLLRRRNLDSSLHLVLWQVGLIGNFDFQDKGFNNHGFSLLVEVLEERYGSDWQVVNYIASSFPAIPPTIDALYIKDLHRDDVRKTFTPLSTLYIPPQSDGFTDVNVARQLGMDVENMSGLNTSYSPGSISEYGSTELAYLQLFDQVEVDRGYSLPAATPSMLTVLSMCSDVELISDYNKDPGIALRDNRFSRLSPRLRQLLAVQHVTAFERLLFEASYEDLREEASP